MDNKIHMEKISVSAPGKLMFLGEHAVVYGRPCIVTAVNKRMKVIVEILNESVFKLEAQDVKITQYQKSLTEVGNGNIPKEVGFVEIALKNFINLYKIQSGLFITTRSDFSSQFGFGSSSAVTVCVIKALSELFKVPLDEKALFNLVYKTVLDIQGKGSGFDVAAAIYGGTIYFKTGREIIEPVSADGLNLVVGFTGVKADTVSMINLVTEKMKNYKEEVEKIFDNIAGLVEESKKAIIDKDWERLGTLMDYNQNYLEDLGVSTEKLNQMVAAAKNAGAYGAKLSGAGGGDCMIALVANENKLKVNQAIEKVGGEIITINVNAPGVLVENL